MASLDSILSKTKKKVEKKALSPIKKPEIAVEERPYDKISDTENSIVSKKINPKKEVISNKKKAVEREDIFPSKTTEISLEELSFEKLSPDDSARASNKEHYKAELHAEQNKKITEEPGTNNNPKPELKSKGDDAIQKSLTNTVDSNLTVMKEKSYPESLDLAGGDLSPSELAIYNLLKKISDPTGMVRFNIQKAAAVLKINSKTLKTLLHRMQEKGVVEFIRCKPGRNAWTVYKLHDLVEDPLDSLL